MFIYTCAIITVHTFHRLLLASSVTKENVYNKEKVTSTRISCITSVVRCCGNLLSLTTLVIHEILVLVTFSLLYTFSLVTEEASSNL